MSTFCSHTYQWKKKARLPHQIQRAVLEIKTLKNKLEVELLHGWMDGGSATVASLFWSCATLADVLGQIQRWECVKGCVNTTDPCGPKPIWLLNGSVTNKMESHLFKSDLSHSHIGSQNQVQIWLNDLRLNGNVTHMGNKRDFYITSVGSWESQTKTLWLQLDQPEISDWISDWSPLQAPTRHPHTPLHRRSSRCSTQSHDCTTPSPSTKHHSVQCSPASPALKLAAVLNVIFRSSSTHLGPNWKQTLAVWT